MNEDFRHPAPDRTKKAKIYEPHTVDDWKQWLKKQKGAMLTDRALKASDAYIELCKHPKHALVLESALFQIRYKKRERGDNRRTVANGGIVCIPDNLLKVYGINGSDTRAKARVRLVTLGFLDPAESGSLFEATKFVIANRWQHFPNVPPPLNQTPIARRVYPECSLSNPDHPIHRARREKSKPDSINECMPSIQLPNACPPHTPSKIECKRDRSALNLDSTTECLSEYSMGTGPDLPTNKDQADLTPMPRRGVQGGTQKGGSHPARSVPNENKIAMYEAPDSTATDDSPRSDRLDKLDRVVTDHGYGPPANRLWRGRTTVRLTYESGLHLLVEPRTVSIEAVWTGTDEELPAKLAVGLPHVIPSRIGANGCPKCQYYHVSDTVKWCTWTNPPLNLMRNDATCLKRRKN